MAAQLTESHFNEAKELAEDLPEWLTSFSQNGFKDFQRIQHPDNLEMEEELVMTPNLLC